MRHFAAAFLLTLLWLAPAHAQNTQCRTAPVGTSSSNCASEAFVTQSVAAAPLAAATKSQQQAGTSNTVAVTPLHQQDHDSAIKAHVNFVGSSGAINGTALNVTSVTRSATGVYVVNFTTAFTATTAYGCRATAETTLAIAGFCFGLNASKSASAFPLDCLNYNLGTATDPAAVDLECTGRQ